MNLNELENLELKKIYKIMSDVKSETGISDEDLDNLCPHLSTYLKDLKSFESLIDLRMLVDTEKEIFKSINKIISIIHGKFFLMNENESISNEQKDFIIKFTQGYTSILIDYYNKVKEFFSDCDFLMDGFNQIIESPLFIVYSDSLKTILLHNVVNFKMGKNEYWDEYEQNSLFRMNSDYKVNYYSITMSQLILNSLEDMQKHRDGKEKKLSGVMQGLSNAINIWMPNDNKNIEKKMVELKDFFTVYFSREFTKNLTMLNNKISQRSTYYELLRLYQLKKVSEKYKTDRNDCLSEIQASNDFAFENGHLKNKILEIKENPNHQFLTENNCYAAKTYNLSLYFKEENQAGASKLDRIIDTDGRELNLYEIEGIKLYRSSYTENVRTISFSMTEKGEKLGYANLLLDIINETLSLQEDNGVKLFDIYKNKIREAQLIEKMNEIDEGKKLNKMKKKI